MILQDDLETLHNHNLSRAMHWCNYQKISCHILYAYTCTVYYHDVCQRTVDDVLCLRRGVWLGVGVICTISAARAWSVSANQKPNRAQLTNQRPLTLCSDPQSGQWPAVTRPGLSRLAPAGGCQGCFALLCSDLQTFPGPDLSRSQSWGCAVWPPRTHHLLLTSHTQH